MADISTAKADHRAPRGPLLIDLTKELARNGIDRAFIDQFMDDFAADENGGHPQFKALAGLIDSREKAMVVAHYVVTLHKMGYRGSADVRRAMVLAVGIWSGGRAGAGAGSGGALGFMVMVTRTYPKIAPFLAKVGAAKFLDGNVAGFGKTLGKGITKVPGAIGIYTAAFESYQASRTGDWGVALGEIAKFCAGKAFPWMAALDAFQNILDFMAPNSPELHKGIAMLKTMNPLGWIGTDIDFIATVFAASLEQILYGKVTPEIAASRVQRFMDRVSSGGHSAAMSEFGYNLGFMSKQDWKDFAAKMLAGTDTPGKMRMPGNAKRW